MSKKIEETEVLSSKRTDLMQIDHRNVVIEDEFNHRSENNFGDIEGLALNMVANGVLDPLLGHKVKGEDRFVLTEGHRRIRGIKFAFQAHADGVAGFEDISKLKLIPMRMVSGNKKDRLLIQASTGFGKVPLTDLEKAELYAELIGISISEGKKRGEAIKELVASLGVSQATVYNTLKLNELDADIKAFVESGQISGGTVVTIIKEVKDVEKQKELVLEAIYNAEEKTKKEGKKVKATASNVKGLKEKSTIQRLKEIVAKLEEDKINNVRARVLFELVENLEQKLSVKKMVEMFL